MSEDLSFAPLLPDDDALMEERLSALAHWCQSFLTGLAAGLSRRGIQSLKALPDEAQEIIQDFAAIAQLETELADDEPEEGEASFVELEEYVKVGALLVTSLINDAGDDTTAGIREQTGCDDLEDAFVKAIHMVEPD